MANKRELRAGLVSVILPTFNRAATLGRSVRSVLSQTYTDIEVLVVDDGSRDNTAEVMAAFDDPRIRYLPQSENRGASAARNVGLREARGEFIAFQDSDDEWLNDKLARQVAAAIEAGRERVSVFHQKVIVGAADGYGRVYGKDLACIVPAGFDPRRLENAPKVFHSVNVIGTPTLLFSADVLDEIGGFDPLLVNSEEWDLAIRLSYATRMLFIAEPLMVAFAQKDSISRDKRGGARSQLRIMRKLIARGDADPNVIGEYLGVVGLKIARLGKRRSGARLIVRSLKLAPSRPKTWARYALCLAGW